MKSPEHVCCRYRLTAYRRLLQNVRHSLDFSLWSGTWQSTVGARHSLRDADAVVVQRSLLPTADWLLVRQFARQLIFDFDDAIFYRDSYARQGIECSYKQRRFRRVVRSVDAVVAGNSFLAEEAARWTDPNKVHIIPTCVDLDRYPLAPHIASDKLRLVWIGSSSTLQGLETVRGYFRRIGKCLPHARLKLICDRDLAEAGMPTEFCAWSEATEAAELSAAEIGISWIPDDPWSRGKCGLKILQYMAAGLPVVANPVGVHPQLIEHGVSGFLATTADEWVDAVRTLARDPELRQRMGTAGRRKVEAKFSVHRGAMLWTNLLDSLAESARDQATLPSLFGFGNGHPTPFGGLLTGSPQPSFCY
ncbi:MAG: glycosyltransferase family 4 protein [Planctomycetia bacterium]|nr:glycosyltransferase family 4 protein [Planctomycetia bacterium]